MYIRNIATDTLKASKCLKYDKQIDIVGYFLFYFTIYTAVAGRDVQVGKRVVSWVEELVLTWTCKTQ